jgi:hypothetical protein
VNLRDSQKVGVIDRTTKKMSIWPLPAHIEDNFPMALNEAEHRLFVVTRTPPRLVIFDTTSGTVVAALPCVADSDDLFYDSKRKRVYIAGGQGFIDVFQEKDPDHFAHLAKVPTIVGAQQGFPAVFTSRFLPPQVRMLLCGGIQWRNDSWPHHRAICLAPHVDPILTPEASRCWQVGASAQGL